MISCFCKSSTGAPRSFALDPENRLLSRFNRQRLDFEALRDSLLYVAGCLDEKIGGESIDITKAPMPANSLPHFLCVTGTSVWPSKVAVQPGRWTT